MPAAALSCDRILEAAEDVLRRFGPGRATVVDVARALGVTHASVYRYFSSKASLREAVVHRWLEVMMPPLEAVAAQSGPAPLRLRRWLDLLVAAKRKRAADDPELFATYFALSTQARAVVATHVDALADQAGRIIADGVSTGDFAPVDAIAAGRAVLYATTRFHHPAHAAEWSDPGIDAILENVWGMVLSGLESRPKHADSPRRLARKSKHFRRN